MHVGGESYKKMLRKPKLERISRKGASVNASFTEKKEDQNVKLSFDLSFRAYTSALQL